MSGTSMLVEVANRGSRLQALGCCSPSNSSAWPQSLRISWTQGLAEEYLLQAQKRPSRAPAGKEGESV